MQKKVIVIAFIVVVLIWVGYMVSRHLGHSKEVEETNSETYKELIRIAKTVPDGGMIQMARILEKYKKEKGSYPAQLIELYPEYIPSQAYLTDIEWDYQRIGENNFRLVKTVEVEGKQETVKVDKTYRVATVREGGSTRVVDTSVDTEESEEADSGEELGVMVASPMPASEEAETPSPVETAAAEREPIDEAEKTLGPMVASGPEIVTVVKEEIAPGIDSRLGGAYLVWKDENGRLGFGNVDYPSSYRLSVYSDGAYQNVRRPQPLQVKSNLAEVLGKQKTKDEIASSMSSQILVWKNKDGTLGFGNVDYPKGDNVTYVNVGGEWEKK